jgi:hypothetical protein
VPLWTKILGFFAALIPGLVLCAISIGLAVLFFQRFLLAHDMLLGFIAVDSVLVVLWWGWTEFPSHFRRSIYGRLQRKRKVQERN